MILTLNGGTSFWEENEIESLGRIYTDCSWQYVNNRIGDEMGHGDPVNQISNGTNVQTRDKSGDLY
jgi:hypothetical protein